METGKPVCARNDYTICQKNQKKKKSFRDGKARQNELRHSPATQGARKLDVFTSEMISKAL
jgi:hypothetical protein